MEEQRESGRGEQNLGGLGEKTLSPPCDMPPVAPRCGRWFLLIGVAIATGIVGLLVARSLRRPHVASHETATSPVTSQEAVPEPPAPPPAASAVPPGPPVAQPEPAGAPQITVEEMKEEAFEVVRRLMDEFPGHSDPLGLMAALHYHYGNTTAAQRWWRKCLVRNPKRVDAYQGLGMIALKKGEYEKAMELWRKAQQINPKLPSAHFRCALALLELAKPQEAIAALEKEIENCPRDSGSYVLLGQAYLQLNELEKARKSYEKAYDIRPDGVGACYGLAIVYARLGQPQTAREYREKFTKLQAEEDATVSARRGPGADRVWPSRMLAGIHASAGAAHRADGNVVRAEEHWRRAAALDSTNVVCRRGLAELLMRRGRHAEAVDFCEQLRKIDPSNATYPLNTGLLRALLEQSDAAEEALRKAIELAPKQAKALRSLARVLVKNRKLSEARPLAQKLVDVEPTAESYALLAEICSRSGDLAGARAALSRAAELNPADSEYKRVRKLVGKGE